MTTLLNGLEQSLYPFFESAGNAVSRRLSLLVTSGSHACIK